MTDFPIKHLSFSSLNLFATCQRSWYGKYIKGDREPMSDAAQFGINFEEAVAKSMDFEVTETIEEREQEKIIATEDMANAERYLSHPRSWKEASAYQKKIIIEPDQFNSICKKFDIKGTIALPYIGFIDFIKTEEAVLDIKTSKRKGWKESWGLQLLSYMIAENVGHGEIHLLTRTKTPGLYFYDLFLTDDLARATLSWIATQAKGVESLLKGDYEACAIPSWMCDYCASAMNCAAKDLRNVPALG